MIITITKRHMRRHILVLLLLAFLAIACDTRLKTVFYPIETEKLSKPVRLALITDLHACQYGRQQTKLLNAVHRQNPDAVLLGGDIFDDQRGYDNAAIAVQALAAAYPCYYVTGNHEYWSEDVTAILDIVRSAGATVLQSSYASLSVNGQTIQICGVDDPEMEARPPYGPSLSQQLAALTPALNTHIYTILMAHRPELVKSYLQYPFDLIVSGHAHGGQWRIPGILNGLYAPHQGLFPPYAGGKYDFGNRSLIVSRGLARESTLIPRIFNRPELVILDLTPT